MTDWTNLHAPSLDEFEALAIAALDSLPQPFRDLTRERLSPSERATTLSAPDQDALDRRKTAMLDWIGQKLTRVLPVLFLLAGILA